MWNSKWTDCWELTMTIIRGESPCPWRISEGNQKELCSVKCYNECPKEEASRSACSSFIGEKLGLEGRVEIQ